MYNLQVRGEMSGVGKRRKRICPGRKMRIGVCPGWIKTGGEMSECGKWQEGICPYTGHSVNTVTLVKDVRIIN